MAWGSTPYIPRLFIQGSTPYIPRLFLAVQGTRPVTDCLLLTPSWPGVALPTFLVFLYQVALPTFLVFLGTVVGGAVCTWTPGLGEQPAGQR